MGFDTFYRVGAHAAIFNCNHEVLLLKQSYGDKRWGLPGGGVEKGETLYEAIIRECKEELNVNITVEALTGFYYHKEFDVHVGIFRCVIERLEDVFLSAEHSEFGFFSIDSLKGAQKVRVCDALRNNACTSFASF